MFIVGIIAFSGLKSKTILHQISEKGVRWRKNFGAILKNRKKFALKKIFFGEIKSQNRAKICEEAPISEADKIALQNNWQRLSLKQKPQSAQQWASGGSARKTYP